MILSSLYSRALVYLSQSDYFSSAYCTEPKANDRFFLASLDMPIGYLIQKY
jgi:hypothetical protein